MPLVLTLFNFHFTMTSATLLPCGLQPMLFFVVNITLTPTREEIVTNIKEDFQMYIEAMSNINGILSKVISLL